MTAPPRSRKPSARTHCRRRRGAPVWTARRSPAARWNASCAGHHPRAAPPGGAWRAGVLGMPERNREARLLHQLERQQMIVTLELWQMITLLLAFFGCVAGFGKIFWRSSRSARRALRSAGRIAARGAGAAGPSAIFSTACERRTADDRSLRLENDFLRRPDLPIHYVRREDYVRDQSGDRGEARCAVVETWKLSK